MEEREGPGILPGAAGEWCTVAEAARRIGITEKAVRERIKHGSIEWRPKGNSGREVLVTPEMERDEPSREPPGIVPEVVELRLALARAEAKVEAVTALAKGEVEAVKRVAAAEVAAMKEQLETGIAARNAVIEELKAGLEHSRAERQQDRARSQTEIDRLSAELVQARKSWLERLLEALRRRG